MFCITLYIFAFISVSIHPSIDPLNMSDYIYTVKALLSIYSDNEENLI